MPAEPKEEHRVDDDMDAFGLPQEIRDQIRSSMSDSSVEDFTLLEENVEALSAFLRCQTQWRHSMSGVTGLDYTAVLQVIKSSCSKKRKRQAIFRDVCLIEQGALKAFTSKRERDAKRVHRRVRNHR